MGTYRLILALAVLLSHAGVTINGFNQGVAAVISFLLISGMVITGMINKRFEGKDNILHFYADRALRIYPQYLFYVLISFLCGFFLLNEKYEFIRLLVNALNIPLNFFVNINTNFLMILPSWSLALELQFYIMIPWLIIYRKVKVATYASLVFYITAYSGVIETDYFGYRMLAGMLFVFLAGAMLLDVRKNLAHIAFIYSTCIMLVILGYRLGLMSLPYNSEVLYGLLIGVPVVALLRRVRFGSLDVLLGNISYALYLNHTIIINLIRHYFPEISLPPLLLASIGLSLTIAYATSRYVEMPFYQLRHRLFK